MFIGSIDAFLRILAATAMAYTAVIVILRINGKRSLSKLNAFDFIVTIALGSVLASTIVSKSVKLFEGLFAFAVLLALQYIVSRTSAHWQRFAKIVRSEPKLLLRDGQFLDTALLNERFTRDEVIAEIRKEGHGRYEDIAAVVLESDGSLSVIADGPCESLTVLGPVNQPGGET
ncbi:DUF421 domain-containing protein [Croceicoccus sediminis]|uniref:DUF421 domain-containing protein n=1 Tax=Croceicoccus sediminis TaxID=2571150 RepID=UPI0011837224|nr:YetF domain-containing protein [Croceicoccus sediminis]